MFCALPAAALGGLEEAAGEVAARIAEKPAGVAEIFDKSVFRHISLEKLSEVLAGVYKENGAVSRTVFVSSAAGSGHFFLDTERGRRVPLALSLDAGSGKINGIFFSPAYKKDSSLKDVRERLAALPGRTGLLVAPENRAALAEALASLLAHPSLRRIMGTSGRKHVLATRTWAANAEVCVQAYSALATDKSRRAS